MLRGLRALAILLPREPRAVPLTYSPIKEDWLV